jgi:hypothetical protein
VQIGLFTPFLQGYLAGVFFGWLGLAWVILRRP